jgi:hypothetical protein
MYSEHTPPWRARAGRERAGRAGAGAALRAYLRAFRGVHKRYLHLYVATYEALVNTKRVTPELIQQMCVHGGKVHCILLLSKNHLGHVSEGFNSDKLSYRLLTRTALLKRAKPRQ